MGEGLTGFEIAFSCEGTPVTKFLDLRNLCMCFLGIAFLLFQHILRQFSTTKKDYLGHAWDSFLKAYGLFVFVCKSSWCCLHIIFQWSKSFSFPLGISHCSWTFWMTVVKLKMKVLKQVAGNVGCPEDWLRSGTALFSPCQTYSMQMWTVALCIQ